MFVFTFITLTMIAVHLKYKWEDYPDFDRWVCWFLMLFLSWASYFLTLLIMRLRHEGKVCSGDYMSNPRLIVDDGTPYIHNNGLFLWYAMIA